MASPADRRRFFRLPAPEILSPAMRPRRRWGAYARTSAVNETLSQLALAAQEGGSLRETLHLIASSPVRRISSLPVTYLSKLLALLFFSLVALSLPYPLTLIAVLPVMLFFFVARGACSQNRILHRVSLAESELAHLLLERMNLGETLSQAMAGMPRVFSPAQSAVVRAGEKAGDLATALRSLAREAQARQAAGVLNFYRQYPILAFFVIAPLALFIVWEIYPKLIDIYAQLGREVPAITLAAHRAVSMSVLGIDVSLLIFAFLLCLYLDHLIRLHLGRLASALGCVVVMVALVGTPTFLRPGTVWIGGSAMSADWISAPLLIAGGLCMPLICDRFRGLCSLVSAGIARLFPWWRRRRCVLERANFLACLGLLLDRRVPAHEALRLAAPALGPAGLEGPAGRAADAVERGESLEVILRRAKLVLPRDQVFLQLAMATGDLPAECRRQSEHLVQDAHDMIARNERILRPLAVLAVAAMGFAVLLAIYVPIFEIAMIIEGS